MKITLTKKNIMLLSLLGLLVVLLGFSFAYFVGGVGTPAITDTSILGEKESRLVFTPGTPINLVASLANFADGSGSLSGETTSTATLTSSSTEEVVSDEYFVYYNITENNYVYTQDASTPELILEVFDNEGNEITTLDGLTFVTTTDALTGETINGFDVTTYKGLIKIKENIAISATHPDNTIDEWTVKLTFINLDADQTLNEGKTFTGELILQGTDKLLLNDLILSNNGGKVYIENKNEPDFTQIAATNEGMFATEDAYGTNYYFRGAVDNNWVSFAELYWRIVSISGNGSIKLIYSGNTAPIESQKVIYIGSLIGANNETFTDNRSDNSGIGYMYTLYIRQGLGTSNYSKTYLESWYVNNLIGFDSFIADNLFCYDRSLATQGYQNYRFGSADGVYTGTGIGQSGTLYGTLERLSASSSSLLAGGTGPSLICPSKVDSFTKDDEIYGNGAISQKIGMLTADEAVFAGMALNKTNSNNYLNSGTQYWLGTPFGFNNSINNISPFYIHSDGTLYPDSLLDFNMGYRPLIYLNSDILTTGSGTWDDPYVVE